MPRTHQRVVPLQLDQHRLHALCDRVLALPHEIRHGLVHLHHFRLASFQRVFDVLGVSIVRDVILSSYLGRIITLVMLRLTSMSFIGDRPCAKTSGSSENALQNPLCRQRVE